MKDVGSKIGRIIWHCFAVFGILYALLYLLSSLIGGSMFVREVVREVGSPDGSAVAEVQVSRGGMGTVNTTRVFLRPNDAEPWTIYETRDSIYQPPLRWIDDETLVVGLPCYRIGHLSNPDDWERSDPTEKQFRVRFEYPEPCE